MTKCKESKNEVAGNRGFSPQDKAPDFQPREGLGYTCSSCRFAYRCSGDLWLLASVLQAQWKVLSLCIKHCPHTHTDVQGCAKGAELVWPPSDPREPYSQGPWAQAGCSEGEWKQNPVNNSKRENTWGQRKRAWNTQDLPLMGFGGSNTEGSQQWQFHEFCTKLSLSTHLTFPARLVQYKENLELNLLYPLALQRSFQEPPRTQPAVYIM